MKLHLDGISQLFPVWATVLTSCLALAPQQAEAKLKTAPTTTASLNSSVKDPEGSSSSSSSYNYEMKYTLYCDGHPTYITTDASGNTQVYVNTDEEGGSNWSTDSKYLVTAEDEDGNTVDWKYVGIFGGAYAEEGETVSCQSSYIKMAGGQVSCIYLSGYAASGGISIVEGDARLDITGGTVYYLDLENFFDGSECNDYIGFGDSYINGRITGCFDNLTYLSSIPILLSENGANSSLYMGANMTFSYTMNVLSPSPTRCDTAFVWQSTTTLYAVGDVTLPFEDEMYVCEQFVDNSTSLSIPSSTSIYIKNSDGWSSDIEGKTFDPLDGQISQGALFISDIKVAGAGSSSTAMAALTDYGYTLINYDTNTGAGGNYVYVGYKTTTDPSKAITGVLMAVGETYCSDSFLESNGTKYILYNDKKYYRCTSNGINDLNTGAGGDYISLYYTRDGNVTEGEMCYTGYNVGASASSGWSYVKYWEGSSNNGTAYYGSVKGNANTNKGTGSKTPDIYMFYTAHTHEFSYYSKSESGCQRRCSCGLLLSTLSHTYGDLEFAWSDLDSCSASVTCSTCGYEVPATVNITSAEIQHQTCTVDGITTYYATATNPVTNVDSLCSETMSDTLVAPGHTVVVDEAVDATCTVDGLTEGSHCSVCLDVLVPQTVIKASHDYAADYYCTVCGLPRMLSTYTLTDGEAYAPDYLYGVDVLTYTRTFSSTAWQALYVPVALPVETLTASGLTVAELNNVHMYDRDDDGLVDDTELEFFRITSGCTEPNYPYLIKPSATGEVSIQLNDAILVMPEVTEISCATIKQVFTIRGTYQGVTGEDMYNNLYYAPSAGGLSRAASASVSLKPQRWYMQITNKSDGSVTYLASSMRISVDGTETEEAQTETAIHDIEATNRQVRAYTLDGRQVSTKDVKTGLYLLNGKKTYLK